jgi:hypothetical protein
MILSAIAGRDEHVSAEEVLSQVAEMLPMPERTRMRRVAGERQAPAEAGLGQ